MAVVFISGHGAVTPDGVYRFLPYDYKSDDVELTTVRSIEFQDFLSKIGGKVLVFLDTCYSGDVFPGAKEPAQVSLDKFANELSAAENGASCSLRQPATSCRGKTPNGGMAPSQRRSSKGLAEKQDTRGWSGSPRSKITCTGASRN